MKGCRLPKLVPVSECLSCWRNTVNHVLSLKLLKLLFTNIIGRALSVCCSTAYLDITNNKNQSNDCFSVAPSLCRTCDVTWSLFGCDNDLLVFKLEIYFNLNQSKFSLIYLITEKQITSCTDYTIHYYNRCLSYCLLLLFARSPQITLSSGNMTYQKHTSAWTLESGGDHFNSGEKPVCLTVKALL